MILTNLWDINTFSSFKYLLISIAGKQPEWINPGEHLNSLIASLHAILMELHRVNDSSKPDEPFATIGIGPGEGMMSHVGSVINNKISPY